MTATFVFDRSQARPAALQFRCFFRQDLLPSRYVSLAYQIPKISVPSVGQYRSFFKVRGQLRVGAENIPMAVDDVADRREATIEGC